MPELPEVETIVRELDKVLPGRKITQVQVLRAKSFQGKADELVGRVIEKIDRRAKMTVVQFKGWQKRLVIHLKMTGQLIFVSKTVRVVGGHPTADWVKELPSKHTRTVIDFDNGARLFFNDMRVFGWMKLMTEGEWQTVNDKLPPDVTDKEFSPAYFKNILGKSGKPIKLLLMDQERFGGVGNIYANDALFLARISPKRIAKELTNKEIEELYRAIKKVIEFGIKYGGASVDKYVDAAGVGGKYQEHFQVYRRNGERCKRDGAEIKKMKLGGRGTYYCPVCQK